MSAPLAAPPPPRPAAWLARATSPWAAAFVLAVFYGALLAGVSDKSLTVDEPGHATAGVIFWRTGDYRFDPENGNLPKRWFALPLLAGGFRTPATNGPSWSSGELRVVADEFFHRLGNDPHAMTRRGRAMAGLLAVALGAGVWLWSRRLFGPEGAMISLLLCALNPGVLANGALMTSDIASALFMLASLAGWWCVLEKATVLRVLASATALGALCVVKMSAVIMIPIALALAVVRVMQPAPLACGPRWAAVTRSQRIAVLAVAAAIHGIVAVGTIWAAHGFRFSGFAPGLGVPASFQVPWERVLDHPPPSTLLDRLALEPAQRQHANAVFTGRRTNPGEWTHASRAALAEVRRTVLSPAQAAALDTLRAEPPQAWPARLAAFALRHQLLPEAYLYGYAYAWSMSGLHPAFFNGETRVGGWRSFFPYVFLVKTPLALLALAALAGIALARTTRLAALPSSGMLPLLLFSAAYWAVAIGSELNIGHRHLLPIYAPLFILCGAVTRLDLKVPGLARRGWPAPTATLALLGIVAVESLCWFPNYLAYFNGLILPSQAHRHVVDSSLDWGQDLPALARYLQRRPATGPLHLAYFGQAEPATHGISARRINAPLTDLFAVLPPAAPEQRATLVADFVQRNPRYDPRLVLDASLTQGPALLLLLHPDLLRYRAGTYVVSASFLPPLYAYAFGDWSVAHERRYRELRAIVDPLLSDDPRQRLSAVGAVPLTDWTSLWGEFETYRFARLTAHLRQRRPDDQINHTLLVYRLSQADLDEALDGPPPLKS